MKELNNDQANNNNNSNVSGLRKDKFCGVRNPVCCNIYIFSFLTQRQFFSFSHNKVSVKKNMKHCAEKQNHDVIGF